MNRLPLRNHLPIRDRSSLTNRLLMLLAALACVGPPAALLCARPPAALAEPYWITYDGSDFPENEGWTRNYGAGGADRWIEGGALALDGRADSSIYDSYSMVRSLDPEPGELFVARWRLKVEELTGWADPSVGIFSDGSWSVAFTFSETRVINLDDPGMSANFELGVFHEFELSSFDMRTFALAIDGSVALTGDFVHVITDSKVSWGDGAVGSASLSRWDYFEFGVIPEPSGALALVVLSMIMSGTKRRVIHTRG